LHAPSPLIAISSGEPAGIGPDICLALAGLSFDARLLVLGDPDLLAERAQDLGQSLSLHQITQTAATPQHRPGSLCVSPVAAAAAAKPGRLDTANADYVLAMIRRGVALCMNAEADALVTAPVHKSVITESGRPFSGHTEFLAELTGAALPVMLLVNNDLRVALATTHLPLREVADAITDDGVEQLLDVLHHDLRHRFGIAEPRIKVLGLNPHAGESGTLGREEIEVLKPALDRARARGIDAAGPYSADTAFTPGALAGFDVVLAMYHDQGLPVIKARGFGDTVNVTCGLPIVRTSVDHGTALELAASGRAKADSLIAAIRTAIQLAGAHRQ
jgi:4-hydroxythreonine-4-phosphate dehydrogenase